MALWARDVVIAERKVSGSASVLAVSLAVGPLLALLALTGGPASPSVSPSSARLLPVSNASSAGIPDVHYQEKSLFGFFGRRGILAMREMSHNLFYSPL